MVAVTNGVHVQTWDRVGGDGLWQAHQARKRELLALIKDRTGRDWDEGTLLLGWARRVTGYKRPLSAVAEAERFASIAKAQGREVRIVFAGKHHPADTEGADLLRQLRTLADGPLKDVLCVLPTYDLGVAEALVSGCDVWLNTPVVGFEACGTSGMKAALNGVLPCSTKDGWMDEIDTFGLGWTLDSVRVTQSFLEVLERDIAPLYYERDADGTPATWVRHMQASRAIVADRFSATRMLRDYIVTLYS